MSQWHKKPTVLVGTAVETSASFTGTGFTSGEIGFFAASTNANTGASIAIIENPFYVAKKGSDVTKFTRRSDYIDAKRITAIRKKAYAAPAAQITYLGYDGASGTSLSYTCDTDYGIKIIAVSPYIRKFYNTQGIVYTGHIHTECCADCQGGCGDADCWVETAKMVQALNDVPAPQRRFVYAEMVADNTANDTVTADAGSGVVTIADGTATFTQNSTTVTFSVNQTIPTGTYLRVSPANNSAPLATEPIFKVATGVAAGTTIQLATPWMRATDTGIVTDSTIADSEVVAVTVASITKCGIKFTGQFLSIATGCCCFPPFPFDFEGVSFLVTDSLEANFPCSFPINANSQELSEGCGTGKEVLYSEMDSFGYTDLRQWFLDCAQNGNYSSDVTTSSNYDVWIIEYNDKFPTTPMSGSWEEVGKVVKIYMPTTTGGSLDTVLTSLYTVFGTPLWQANAQVASLT